MAADFQQRVLQQLAAIPYARVISYGRLAELAGSPGAARAVGRCLRQLPKDTGLPWHRVVKATGEIALAGRGESGQLQVRRLEAEGVEVLNHRCDLKRFGY